MSCLIWRQHREQALWAMLTVTALCLLFVKFGLSAEHWLAGCYSRLRQLAAAPPWPDSQPCSSPPGGWCRPDAGQQDNRASVHRPARQPDSRHHAGVRPCTNRS